LTVSEIPIQFGYREAGESKASALETFRFFRGLLRLRLGGNLNFVKFMIVGLTGTVVNTLALAAFTEFASLYYLVSAIFATQISTLWNFGLTETWVFGKHKTEKPLVLRFISFLIMNNFLLLLRGPLLALMVSQLHINYLIANIVSLSVIVLVRYTVADKLIWNKGRASRPIQNNNMENINNQIGATK